eukprot:TRINITY_DN4210_c0_g1_i1.p1 TRINITY_DN4210_c0_g1~~TRINITY_DN4210_c0_g1_i1.p1  ORF type:complete len:509 (-),score=71.10 TRINITY_DN4210_c0_g1_i1:563-2089(-)
MAGISREDAFAISFPVLVLVLMYVLSLVLLGPGMMLPGEAGFALFACWVCGLLGGKLMEFIHQPPLLGMLIAGILLRNIGSPSIVQPLPETWAAAVRVFGLSVILMRSGLELDLGAIKRIGPACIRLTVCPGCSEAVAVSLAAALFFGMPIALALSLGFILAAVSPAVVVGGMFDLQRRGYGTAKGIPSLVVAAASFDDVVAITGYSLAIGFAIQHEGANLLWEAMHGPINVALGMVLGIIGGVFISRHVFWDNSFLRTAVTGLVGLTFAFFCDRIHFTGAGALASLTTTCVAARSWNKLREEDYEDAPHDDPSKWAHHVEVDLAIVWSRVAQPLLFCVIGAALDFAALDAGTIPLSILVVFVGVCVRCPVAGLVTFNAGLCNQEKLFVGLAWIPKATVQAALGGLPLDLARTTLDKEHDPEMYDKYEKFGLQILTTAVFSILITAPIGLLVIQNLGHKWLSFDGLPGSPQAEEVSLEADVYGKDDKSKEELSAGEEGEESLRNRYGH